MCPQLHLSLAKTLHHYHHGALMVAHLYSGNLLWVADVMEYGIENWFDYKNCFRQNYYAQNQCWHRELSPVAIEWFGTLPRGQNQ